LRSIQAAEGHYFSDATVGAEDYAEENVRGIDIGVGVVEVPAVAVVEFGMKALDDLGFG
jgi:hypothetical protein